MMLVSLLWWIIHPMITVVQESPVYAFLLTVFITIITTIIYVSRNKQERRIVGYISELYTHPVKTARAINLKSAQVTQLGVQYDRQYVLVNEHGTVIDAKKYPQLSAVKQTITNDAIVVEYEGREALRLPLFVTKGSGYELTIKWLQLTTFGVHVSDNADAWFTELFDGHPVRLFCYPSDGVPRRSIDKGVNVENYSNEKETIMWANSCPILLLSESSVESLKELIQEDVSVGNFRPSIVVTNCAAFEEEKWSLLEINNVRLQVLYPAPRCPAINLDPITLERNKNIEKKMGKQRCAQGLGYNHPLLKNKALFGMYFGVRREGSICVGDPIYELLE